MPDGWEAQYSLDLLSDDGADDPDLDLVSNLDEYLAGTNPLAAPKKSSSSSGGGCAPGGSSLSMLLLALVGLLGKFTTKEQRTLR